MANKHQVLKLFLEHPDWTSGQIAQRLGCDSAYVRSTLTRNGLKLSWKAPLHKKAAAERERCALIAETKGYPDLAAAIRSDQEAGQ